MAGESTVNPPAQEPIHVQVMQPTPAPQTAAKAHSSAVGTAFVTLIMWGATKFGGLTLTSEESIVIGGALIAIVNWFLVFLVPNREKAV